MLTVGTVDKVATLQYSKLMAIVTAKHFRDNFSQILDQVAFGRKQYIVSKFGRKQVIISPFIEKKQKLPMSKHPACGMWKDRKDMKDPVNWVRDMRIAASK